MDEIQAVELVREYVKVRYPDYPAGDLVTEEFKAGWVVFPRTDPADLDLLRMGQIVFVVGRNGELMAASSSLPPGQAEAVFMTLYGDEELLSRVLPAACRLLGFASEEEAREGALYLYDVESYFFSRPDRDGAGVIIAADGTFLYVDSSVPLNRHRDVFAAGRRSDPAVLNQI